MAYFKHNEYKKRNLYPSREFSEKQKSAIIATIDEITKKINDDDYASEEDSPEKESALISNPKFYFSSKPKVRSTAQICQIERLLTNLPNTTHFTEEKTGEEMEVSYTPIFNDSLRNIQALTDGGYLENPMVLANEILLQNNLVSTNNKERAPANVREKISCKTNYTSRKRNGKAITLLDEIDNLEPLIKKVPEQIESKNEVESEKKLMAKYVQSKLFAPKLCLKDRNLEFEVTQMKLTKEKENKIENEIENIEKGKSETEDEYEKIEKSNNNKKTMQTFSEEEVQSLQSQVEKYNKEKEILYLSLPPRTAVHKMWDWSGKVNNNNKRFSDHIQ